MIINYTEQINNDEKMIDNKMINIKKRTKINVKYTAYGFFY